MPLQLIGARIGVARLAREGARDLREHPHVATQALARRAPRRLVVEHAALLEPHAERACARNRIAFCSAGRRLRHGAQPRAQLVLGRPRVGGAGGRARRCAASRAAGSRRARERALDADEAVPLGEELVVARAELARGHAEEVALVALGEERAGAPAEVVRERARVAAQHGEDEVGAARDAAVGVVERDARR